MRKGYVSEFENFMGQYLQDHPEEVAAKRRGWSEFWRPEVNPAWPVASHAEPDADKPYGIY